MRLPDPIEREIRVIEAEWEARPGQRAGTPRARGLRGAIEDTFRQMGLTYHHWKELQKDLPQ